jgi:hypothetical protein
MPAPESQEERRDERLITGLFWGGVGIAPLAALLLLIGQSGGLLRIAAVLAILAVVMIGLSITLRGNSDAMRVELEEVLYEEIDALRKDVREDIGTAARATHKSFGEKLQVLYEQLNAVRAQLDAIRAEAGRTEAAPAVRHTETVQVTTRQTIVDPHRDEAGAGASYGRHGGAEDAGWSGQRSRREGRRSRSYERDEDRPGYEPAARYVERYEAPRHGEPRYEAPRYEEPRYEAPRYEEPRYEAPRYEEPRYEAPRYEAPRYEEPRYEEPRYEQPRHGEDRYGEPTHTDRWSGVRAGDRWGSVREDDRGREVRMGERRAAVHADDSGTEVRYEDRWAAMRSAEPRRDAWRGSLDRVEEPPRPPDPMWGRRAVAALPAGGQPPQQLWDSEPEREPAPRRREEDTGYRYRTDPDDRWRR